MKRVVVALSAMLLLFAGCRRTPVPPKDEAGGLPQVYTVNYPLAYFAERIGADTVEVIFPAPTEGDPAFWQPSNEEICRYQQADLVLANGADYAKWRKTATLPTSTVVDTSRAFADEYLRHEGSVTHSHGPEGAHEHGALDFTTWLAPPNARRQAAAVRDAIVKLCPDEESAIRRRFRELDADLEDVDGLLHETAQALGNQVLVASHPVYNYMAHCYGMSLVSLHWEPEGMPPDEEWAKLSALVKERAIRIMLWEDEPEAGIARRVEQAGLRTAVFRPCGNRPPEGDYLTEMKQNVRRLRECLER